LQELVRSGPYSVEHGRAAAEELLTGSPTPDGVVAANNKILIGVLEALTAAGERARRVAVAGFDGVPFASFLGRPVAIAEQPERDIGTVAARMLIDRIEGKKAPPREEVLRVTVKKFWGGKETLNTQALRRAAE
jgi:LacI family transcriptional regulator